MVEYTGETITLTPSPVMRAAVLVAAGRAAEVEVEALELLAELSAR